MRAQALCHIGRYVDASIVHHHDANLAVDSGARFKNTLPEIHMSFPSQRKPTKE
jgi:hypothetical protein